MHNEDSPPSNPLVALAHKAGQSVAQGWDNLHLGLGHGQAWVRAGFKELATVLAAFPDSVQPQEELGLFGSNTAWGINQQMGNTADAHDREHDDLPARGR